MKQKQIARENLKQYVGQYIYAVQADGTKVKGKLVSVDHERVYLKPISKSKGKKVQTNCLFGLFIVGVVAFGLLAWGFGGWGGGGGCCRPNRCCCPSRERCRCKRRHGRRVRRRRRRHV